MFSLNRQVKIIKKYYQLFRYQITANIINRLLPWYFKRFKLGLSTEHNLFDLLFSVGNNL